MGTRLATAIVKFTNFAAESLRSKARFTSLVVELTPPFLANKLKEINMSARILVSQALIITADLEMTDEHLLTWLETQQNLFDYLTPDLEDNLEINIRINSLDHRNNFDVQSIKKSDGSEWKWDGEHLTTA
jgi:hypothetical protein